MIGNGRPSPPLFMDGGAWTWITGFGLLPKGPAGIRFQGFSHLPCPFTAGLDGRSCAALGNSGRPLHGYTNSSSVPAVISASPAAALAVSRSLRNRREKATVTRMLSLSMGTTTLAGPSCSAR